MYSNHLTQTESDFLFICYLSFVASKLDTANKMDNGTHGQSKLTSHKFLQVELLADEHVAAKHGNDTADFLLVLANIVSFPFL